MRVKEKALIRRIYFVGNKKVKDDLLKSEISSVEKDILYESKVKADTLRLIEIYKRNGRIYAKVVPKIIKKKNGQVDLVFEINEGDKIAIKSIKFEGNRHFSARKLKKKIRSKDRFLFFFSTDAYDPDKLYLDGGLLKRFYKTKGYYNFSLLSSSAIYDITSNYMSLSFLIKEGARFRYNDFHIINNIPELSDKEFKKLLITRKNKIVNIEDIEQTVKSMENYLLSIGYSFANVDYDIKDNKNNTLDVNYIINKTDKVVIRRIIISGNYHSLDRIIRKELRIAEGDIYNVNLVRRSSQRLRNLGYFSKVDFQVNPISKKLIDIEIVVEEQPTGSVEFGVSYSSYSRFSVNAGFKETNLLGIGHKLYLGVNISKIDAYADISYTVPYQVGDYVKYSLFSSSNNFTELPYSSKTNGASIRMGYSITEYLQHSVSYSFNTTTVTDIEDTASQFTKEQEGRTTYSLIGHRFFYNRLDNNYVPTSGYLLSLGQELATLGGDARYLKNYASAALYSSFFAHKITLKLSAKAGHVFAYAGRTLKINNRYFKGGEGSIRGFENSGIGPRDLSDQSALGGTTYYEGTAQISYSLGETTNGFDFVTFMDAGNAFGLGKSRDKYSNVYDGDKLRVSAGIGLSWRSPLGLLLVSWAVPFVKSEHDKVRRFAISIGAKF